MTASPSRRILVTGADGNLGRKLVAALAAQPWCSAVLALDRAFAQGWASETKVRAIAADLTAPSPALAEALETVDAVVHLAARNPYPEASWADAAASFDMTAILAGAAGRPRAGPPRRFVFASSNHVMGGYKDQDPAPGPGMLTTDLPPRPGTRTGPGDVPRAYAAAKLMGERLLAAEARAGGLTAVSLRIGWCQPGRNHPGTLSAAGVPGAADPEGAGGARELAWFRAMWLSDRDFVDAVSSAVLADAGRWPSPSVVVNAMSDNAGMPWDIATTRRLIGYAPRDDVWRVLGAAP